MLKSEILFVDPSVSDIATILSGLRPEVEAIVLDSSRPAARQIAEALRGRRGLDAVHVIAHGAPGRVRFAAGEWSATTLGKTPTISQPSGGRSAQTAILGCGVAAPVRVQRATILSGVWRRRAGLTLPLPRVLSARRPKGAHGG